MSRKIYLLISVVALVAIFFLIALKFEDNSSAEFSYEPNEDGKTAAITGFNGNVAKLDIPGEIDGYKITSISDSAFTNMDKLKNLSIDGNIESIGQYAFENCTSLKKVNLNEGLLSIGHSAFYGCSSLKTVNLPDTLQGIDDFAFCLCTRLKSLKIPASCTTIGTDAFAACESLILDCSENSMAYEVALSYSIPTSFENSFGYLFLKIVVLTLIIGALTAAAFIVLPKIIKRKSKKLTD